MVALCPQLLHVPFKNWWYHQHLLSISYLPVTHLPFIITFTPSSNHMWWALWLFPFDRWGRLCLDRLSDEFRIKQLGNGGAGTWIQAFWLECALLSSVMCWLYLEKDFTLLFHYNFYSYWHCIWRPKRYKLVSYPESWGALPVLERLNHVTWLG